MTTRSGPDPDQSDPRLDRVYPSDYRPLARLWWTGSGKMTLRVDRISLTFKPEGGEEQQIPTPMAPLTPAQFVQLLTETVTDKDGVVGGLKGEVFDATDTGAVYPMPSGASLAAHNDDETDADKIAAGLRRFRRLTGKNNRKSLTLYHVAKPYQAVFMGTNGTFRAPTAEVLAIKEATQGYTYVTDPVLDGDRPNKVMSRAAELGALLCMGAAGHVTPGASDSDKVYQVFRNWNLDRRRVNEWKMLIAGGALSDKPGAADAYDGAMPGGDLAPADSAAWTAPVAGASPSVIAEAEGTALELGWINTLEDWLVALEAGKDMTSADVADPTERTPRSLSRAMAFIFDAPDPAGGAV